MALFGKKKQQDFEEEFSSEANSEGFFVNFGKEEEAPSFFQGAHKAPHAITIDEVLHGSDTHNDKPAEPTFAIPMSGSGEYSAAAKNLMNRMMRAKNIVNDVADGKEEQPQPEEEGETAAAEELADTQKVEEILAKANAAARPAKPQRTEFASPEFMEKLKGFLNDDADTPKKEEPADENYSLASVDDILRSVEKKVKQKSLEESLKKDVSINYNVPKAEEKEEPQPIEEKKAEPEMSVTKFEDCSERVQIDVVHIDPADDDLESTRPVPLSFQFSFADEDLPNTDIETAIAGAAESAEEKTIQFDSISEEDATESRDISSASEAAKESRIAAFRLEPMEEAADSDEEGEEYDEFFQDYSCIDDAPEFKRDLRKRCTSLLMRIVPTAVLTVLMTVLSLPVFAGAGAENFTTFRVISLVLFGITLAININTLMGVTSIFRGRPDMDSPIAISSLLAFVYSCACVVWADTLFLGAPVGLVLLVANLSKYLMENRIAKDFNRIATADSKLALKLIDEAQGSADIAKGAGLENVLVGGTQRTVNITGFFKKCYSVQPFEKFLPATLIIGGTLGLLAGAISYVLTPSIVAAIGCMLTLFVIFCPPTYCLLNVLPYISAAKDVAASGALLCGQGGAEAIGEANAMVFNADQLFPAGTVNLYQMKILSPNPIDYAIVEAAAVATAAKSPLADMFNRMAQGRQDVVSDPVDSINLEGNMGISGWIKDRRILIGNRLLMETHGIAIPPVNVDRNILEKGFFPVYVACAGVPCALFVVGYNVDRRVKYELQRLCNTGAVVLVNSTDPNISEEMISDYFGIWRESVRLMNANSLNIYKNAVNYQESVDACGIYSGSAEGLACLLTASVRLGTAVRMSIILNFVFIALGALLCCYSIFTTGLPAITTLAVLVLHLINMGAAALVPLLYKP